MNDEIRMTNDEYKTESHTRTGGNTDEDRQRARQMIMSAVDSQTILFDIRHSGLIRHSSFVIRHLQKNPSTNQRRMN